MEKWVVYILLLLPGFLAAKTSELIGSASGGTKKADRLFSYAAFSAVANSIILPAAVLMGIVPGGATVESVADVLGVGQIAIYLVVSSVVSIAIGAAWSLWIGRTLLEHLNRWNLKHGRMAYSTESALDSMLKDGKYHFVIVQKDGNDIGVGFVIGVDNDTQSIVLADYPEYRTELHRARTGKPSYLANRIKTFYDATTGLVIYETEYPPTWAPERVQDAPAEWPV